MNCVVCDRKKKITARGMCPGCYTRWNKTGSTEPTYLHGLTLEEAFWRRVDRRGPEECWTWLGSTSTVGYGRLTHEKTLHMAHRLSYELQVGPIADGLVIDHLCRTTNCVNPAHLEPVTTRTNVLRGIGPSAANTRKTHCPAGHPYAGENLAFYKTYRMCRTCKRQRARAAS